VNLKKKSEISNLVLSLHQLYFNLDRLSRKGGLSIWNKE